MTQANDFVLPFFHQGFDKFFKDDVREQFLIDCVQRFDKKLRKSWGQVDWTFNDTRIDLFGIFEFNSTHVVRWHNSVWWKAQDFTFSWRHVLVRLDDEPVQLSRQVILEVSRKFASLLTFTANHNLNASQTVVQDLCEWAASHFLEGSEIVTRLITVRMWTWRKSLHQEIFLVDLNECEAFFDVLRHCRYGKRAKRNNFWIVSTTSHEDPREICVKMRKDVRFACQFFEWSWWHVRCLSGVQSFSSLWKLFLLDFVNFLRTFLNLASYFFDVTR